MKPIQQEHPIKVGKPKWLRKKLPTGPQYEEVRQLLKKSCLNTVCQEAHCPNQFECYSKGTATFMILGDKCTRNCAFCAVGHGPDSLPDENEPRRVAEAVKKMALKYVVITSVTRDDLTDGGAAHFISTMNEIRQLSPGTLVEILISDLRGNWEALKGIIDSGPDVINHNIETVSRLYPQVRSEAVYERSLQLLDRVKRINPKMVTKSGIMVGLGEGRQELLEAMDDLLEVRCDILTLGQYLQPSRNHLPVFEFVTPQIFEELQDVAMKKGFKGVASGPTVRSSYEAGALYNKVVDRISS